MTYETFLKMIPDLVQANLGEWAKVRLHTIHKNNNVKREALCILEEGCNVSPTLYLEPYFDCLSSGISLEQVCQKICQDYEVNRCGLYLNVEDFCDFEKMKDQIVYKLIHYESNRELLQDVPHRRFLDLAVVYSLLIENHFLGSGTAMIHHTQCRQWQVTEETLYHCAARNTDRLLGSRIQPIRQVILSLLAQDMNQQLASDIQAGVCTSTQVERWAAEILERMMPREHYAMYMLSNQGGYLGAAAVLQTGQLQAFSRRLGCGLYVIPSSVHEVILLPETEGFQPKELRELLQQVNASEDNVQDFLSDQVYYFDPETGLKVAE